MLSKIFDFGLWLILTALCILPAHAAQHDDTLIQVIEISYGYNSMSGGESSGRGNPVGSLPYCGQPSAPIVVEGLAAGTYTVEIVAGRQTGNPGCGRFAGENGFAGGNTNCNATGCLADFMALVWLGESITEGQRLSLGGVGTARRVDVQTGQNLWFYWHDWYIDDNYGGVTLELRLHELAPQFDYVDPWGRPF